MQSEIIELECGHIYMRASYKPGTECAACNYKPTKNSHAYKKRTTGRFVNQTYMRKVLPETQVVLVEVAQAEAPPSFL